MAKAKKVSKPSKKVTTKRVARTASAPSLSARDREVLVGLGKGPTPRPELAVGTIVHEARELETALAKLGPALIKGTDLDKNVARELSARIARLTAAEQAWLAARKITTPKPIGALRESGESLRTDAFAALRYFARDDGDTQTSLDAIAEGRGDADLIDDLGKLSTLIERHASLLVRADLPKKPADALRAAAERLADAAADRAVDPSSSDALELRNRAYWHLRELMDTIRAAGRYVYRHDPRLLSLFRGSRARARDRSRPSKKAATPAQPPA